jgi:hypothetical protein
MEPCWLSSSCCSSRYSPLWRFDDSFWQSSVCAMLLCWAWTSSMFYLADISHSATCCTSRQASDRKWRFHKFSSMPNIRLSWICSTWNENVSETHSDELSNSTSKESAAITAPMKDVERKSRTTPNFVIFATDDTMVICIIHTDCL